MDDSNIGQIFGDFKIIRYIGIGYNRGKRYEAECVICGTKKEANLSDLKRIGYKHSSRNCKKYFINKEIEKTYGDLTIIGYLGMQSNNHKYLAKCNICNRKKSVWIKDIRKGIGISHKDCCLLIEKDKYFKKFRTTWAGLRDRTTNSNCSHYHSYGGRGITSDDYEFFIDFYDDMYDDYLEHIKEYGEENTTLDRIDVNGNYEKSNLRWTTWEVQLSNTTRNKKFKAISPDGQLIIANNQTKFARQYDIDYSCINSCLNGKFQQVKGWTFQFID